jgi:hypothetical protein
VHLFQHIMRDLTLISDVQGASQGSNLHPFLGLRLTNSPLGQRRTSEALRMRNFHIVRKNHVKCRDEFSDDIPPKMKILKLPTSLQYLPSVQVWSGHGGKLQSSNGLRRYTCPVGQTLTSKVHGGGGLHCASVNPAACARHRLLYGHSFVPQICGSYLFGRTHLDEKSKVV